MSDELDETPRYVPLTIMCRMVTVPVTGTTVYPSDAIPHHAPIKVPSGHVAVEIKTAIGSRWLGFRKAWINSELRMVVQGFNPRDVVRASWEKCGTP